MSRLNTGAEAASRTRETLMQAIAHHRAGRRAAAKRLYDKILSAAPNQPDALNLSGVLALEDGRVDHAIRLMARAVKANPGHADAHNNLGNALKAAGRTAEAASSYERALALKPGLAAAHSNLAVLRHDAGDTGQAIAGFELALSLDASLPGAALGLARSLRSTGRLDEAASQYRRALRLDETNAIAWNELGRCLRSLGDLTEARACFLKAVERDPGLADAHRNLALMDEPEGRAERVGHLRAAADGHGPAEQRAVALFALGKTFEDEGRYDEAFHCFAQGNRLMSALHAAEGRGFDIAALRRTVDLKIASPAVSPGSYASSTERPVFVVGLPRSGTSLVEQIAASHTKVHGAGELRLLAPLGEAVATGDAAQARGAVDAYLARLDTLGQGADRVIDKMPDNLFHLETVAALFPSARVILCERDARDVSLSCYFQLFSAGNAFSYDLEACGRRCVQTARLADHYRTVSGLNVLTVQYERLVADLEGESRRLIDFLGLSWEPACLDFHRTRRVVETASGWQVRQPLYASSVGRWMNYRPHLGGLIAALEDEAARSGGDETP